MSPSLLTWRVIRSQQDMARNNARQALLVIQQRRREQAESDLALPLPLPLLRGSMRRTRASEPDLVGGPDAAGCAS